MLVKECEETAPVFPYWKYDPFSLENMLEDECLSEFRVSKLDHKGPNLTVYFEHVFEYINI